MNLLALLMAPSESPVNPVGEDSALPEGTHSDQAQLPGTPSEVLPPSGDEVEKELVKKIFRLLWGYAIFASAARMIGLASFLGIIDLAASGAKGVDSIFCFLYYILPFIALYWAYFSDPSQLCLLFFQGWAAVATCSHIVFAIIILPFPWAMGRGSIVSFLLLPTFLLGAIMICLFVNARRLFLHRDCAGSQKQNRSDIVIAVLLVFLLCLSPLLSIQKIINGRREANEGRQVAYERSKLPLLNDLVSADSRIKGIQGSPDGKYLAVGGEGGLYLWDVEKRVCVWQDITISPDILRFSRSGKYLAVATSVKGAVDERNKKFVDVLKRIVDNTAKPLAIYEVATRKPLSLRLLPREPEKPQIILDIAFDADEKNLHVAFGWISMVKWEWLGHINASIISLANGIQKQTHVINKSFGEWLSSWSSASYAADASHLFYLQVVDAKGRRSIALYNTQRWQRRVIEQDKKYDITVIGGNYLWRGWEERKGQLYFFANEENEDRHLGVLFSLVDLKSGATRNIYSSKASGRNTIIYRIALSPDGTKAALLRGCKVCDVHVYIVRLGDGKVLQELESNYPTNTATKKEIEDPWFLSWVRDDLLIVANRNRQITWIPIEKGLDKDGD